MHSYYSLQMVGGVVSSTNKRKQEIGQKLASHLSFIPGPLGSDGSVDGAITDERNGLVAHFQSKLSSELVSLDEAKILHSDLLRLKPKVCVYVAGVGYQESFKRLLDGQSDISDVDIHLLTLEDVFLQTDTYRNALAAIPTHSGGHIDFSAFRV